MVIDTSTCKSITDLFLRQAERLGDRPFLWAKRNGAWAAQSWSEAKAQMLDLAAGLKALGLVPGDRVMIVSENRPEWAIADLAIMAAGGVSVPAYTTNTSADHLHIINNSGARFVVSSTRALTDKVLVAAGQTARPPTIIAMDPPPRQQASGPALISWAKALELGRATSGEVAKSERTDTACIIYTSGTGGAPRGVMLSHGALLADCWGAWHLLESIASDDEVFLSFLPLSHSYEHTVGLMFPISLGAQIYYAESIDQLASNMAETHPTIMTAVPRLYESMRARILHGINRKGGMTEKLFMAAVNLGSKRYTTGRLGPVDGVMDRVVDRLVRSKVQARFGGRLKALVSGGAPLSYEVGLFFTALGIRILQGYGQTEAGPAISCNPPDKIKIDSVGPPLAGIELRLAEDGEIMVRGEVVMQGYWNDAAGTAQTVRDGWLHTGDIGEIDGDGYVRITDRKKDIIVNSGGDNISPQRVEGFLTLQPEIAQAMVMGDRRPHLVALLVPDAAWAEAWARTHHKPSDLAELVGDADFRRAMTDAVERVNKTLSAMEKIRRTLVIAEGFTTENGMLTPTLKIRRHVIRQVYGEKLEGLYGG